MPTGASEPAAPELRLSRMRANNVRLALYVLCGLVAGGAFVAFDLFSEAHIGAGTLEGPMARAHDVVDHGLPFVIGALLGVCAHYLSLRRQLSAAEAEAERAASLRARLQRVERDQAVWVLAAAILHELNNPLHALGLALDELDAAPDDAARAGLLTRARAQSERALAALLRLRALRDVEDPQIRLYPLDELMRTLTADAAALAAEDGIAIRLECAGSLRVHADPRYVRAIVENLLHNSIQSLHGRRRGEIRVTAERLADGRASLRFSDDGPPLDPAIAENVFKPLVSTKRKGLGLGLPIARALARAMDGDLRLERADRKSFVLELPGEAG